MSRFSVSKEKEIKGLSSKEREQLGLDDYTTTDTVVDNSPSRKLTQIEQQACHFVNDDKTQGKVWLVKSRCNAKFSMIICDEAHNIKNAATKIYQLVAAQDRDCLLLSSATPMLNHVRDNLGYLRLAFPHIGALPAMPADFDCNTLYSPVYDPTQVIGATNYRALGGKYVNASGAEGSSALIDKASIDPKMKAYVKAFEDEEIRYWVLSPRLFKKTAIQHKWDYDSCNVMVRHIIKQVYLKRTMYTKVKLPDGSYVCPGDSLQGATFRMMHVRLSGQGKHDYDHLHARYENRLYKGKDEKTKVANSYGEADDEGVTINMGVWRHLGLTAINANNLRMLGLGKMDKDGDEEDDENAKDEHSGEEQENTKVDEDDDDENGAVTDPKTRGSEPEAGLPAPKPTRLGANLVRHLAMHIQDGGAQTIYKGTTDDERIPAPEDRLAWIKYLTARSAPLSAVILQVLEWTEKPTDEDGRPNRVVIMVDSPWTQQ